MKLSQIKMELAKLLVQYSVIKTDNGILNFEGKELLVGADVYVEDENGEKVIATDGEYKTEDNKIITVVNGKVESIVEVEIEDDVEPTEEVTELEEEVVEDVNKEEVVEETNEPIEEVTEEITELEEETNKEDVNTEIENIRKEINELYNIIDSILKKINESREQADTINDINERLKKIECSSVAHPATVEFEQITTRNNTGDAKLDKFLNKYGNK